MCLPPRSPLFPYTTLFRSVLYGLRRAGLRAGYSVVIQGAGGLGINAVAVARDMGADRIIVIDRLAERLELARPFGEIGRASCRERVYGTVDGSGTEAKVTS